MNAIDWVWFGWTMFWMAIGIWLGFMAGDHYGFMRACKTIRDTFVDGK